MKNTLFKNSFLLIIGSIFTKIISMIIKMFLARNISSKVMGLYMMANPLFLLIITLCTFGFTNTVSKLISENKKKSLYLIFIISPLINIILMIFLFLFRNYIILLFDKNIIDALYGIILTIPFISMSSIIRGYFFGKEKVKPFILSEILGEIIRLILTIYIVKNYDGSKLLFHMYFINIFSELTSILIMLIFLPKKIKLKKEYFKYHYLHDILDLSLPQTFARLIGTIGYLFEPIIILNLPYKRNYILKEYGLISGFIMPLVLIPSFLTNSISQALLPEISKYHNNHNYSKIKKRIKQGIILSLLLGLPFTILFLIFPDKILYLVYHKTKGINYLKILSIFGLFYYIEGPLITSLHGIGKSYKALIGTILGTIFELIILFILSHYHIGLYSLIIGEFVCVITTCLYDYLSLIRKNK